MLLLDMLTSKTVATGARTRIIARDSLLNLLSSFIVMKTRVSFSLYFLSFDSIFSLSLLTFQPLRNSFFVMHPSNRRSRDIVCFMVFKPDNFLVHMYICNHTPSLFFSSLLKKAEITLPYSLHIETFQQQ